MENRNIIIILVAVVIVLAVVAGIMFLQPTTAKEPTKVKITSDKSQYEGGKVSIQLTDLNKTGISKEIVNITITNKKGKIVFDNVVRTDSKGKAKLDLNLKKGEYKVNVTYGGNENYTGNSTSQNLTIKEVKTAVESNSKSYPEYNPTIGHYRSTGINQDELGVVELQNGQYIVIAGDGYYEYLGQDSQGNIKMGNLLIDWLCGIDAYHTF